MLLMLLLVGVSRLLEMEEFRLRMIGVKHRICLFDAGERYDNVA